MADITVEELINELNRIVVGSQESGLKQAQDNIHELFTKETDDKGKEVYTPITKFFRIEEGVEVEVPQGSTRHLHSIALKEFKLKIATDVELGDKKDPKKMKVGLKRNPFTKSTHIELEATYEAQELPEGVALLQDHLNKQISDKI